MTLTNVPTRAAEWIAQFLNNHEKLSNRNAPREARHIIDLNVLSVKESKCIAKEIKNKTISAALKGSSDVTYSMPTSGSGKALLVSSIANAFASSQIINIMTDPQIAGVALPGSSAILTPRAKHHRSSKGKESAKKKMREKASPAAKASPDESKTAQTHAMSTKRNAAQPEATSTLSMNSVPLAARVGDKTMNLPGKKAHSQKKVTNSSIQPAEAVERSSQQNNMYDTLSSFENNHFHIPHSFHPPVAASATFASGIYTNGHHEHDLLLRPEETDTASVFAARCSRSQPKCHRKRPHSNDNSSSHTATSKIQVKAESNLPTLQSTCDDSLQPRDYRESAIVESLRNMGFTDMREMLSGIRATSTDAEQGCVFLPHQWNFQQQAEAAMMWIVNQREEAAEAKKLDEARVSSEMAERAMKESRREENERRLKCATLKDLFGSVELGSGDVTSKFFPCSMLLKNVEVRKILHAIGNGPGKDESIRLLQLEVKAKKWYGTVLPFAHFRYDVCPRFEKWSKKFISSSKGLDSSSTSVLIKKVAKESKKLEQGMYNLSEQEMGSFGMAPKLFLVAQRDAEASGKSLCDEASNGNGDDEIEIVSAANISRCSPSLHRSTERERKNAVEIIDLS
ncbi:hypothetical protein ACHAW6_007486 [Cyclotella cf. meneghiniana]